VPITYRIDADSGVVHVTFQGRVTVDEFREHRKSLVGDAAFRPSMHRLTDVRELTALPSTDELRSLAEVGAEARRNEPAGVRRGVIVSSPAAYGIVRQYQAFLEFAGRSVDILASDEEVRMWIAGLPVRTESGGGDS
jgi:hypothetical protein